MFKPRAFSLIELSIVILVVSILLTGALGISIQNANNDRIKSTNQKIEEIYKAMGAYLAINGRLPCPASMILDKSNSNYGSAASTCSAAPSSGSGYWRSNDSTNYPNLYYGALPVQTLNLPADFAEDGFGTKFGYMILTGFTRNTSFGYGTSSVTNTNNLNFSNNVSTNRIIIKEKPASTARNITTDAMFAIISYGPNKSGGWSANATSTSAQNTVSTDSDEGENDVDSPDSTAGVATFDGILMLNSGNSDIFDDIIFYKTRDQMTMDFNLLHLVACDNGTSTKTYGDTTFTWGSTSTCNATSVLNSGCVKYGEAATQTSSTSSRTCVTATPSYSKGPTNPTKRCGPFGVWESGVTDNCLN